MLRPLVSCFDPLCDVNGVALREALFGAWFSFASKRGKSRG